jgi:hypothetical protein
LSGSAQNEFSSKFKPIAPKTILLKLRKQFHLRLIFLPLRLQMYLKPELLNPNPSPSLSITPESNFSMTPKNEFMNPSDVYRDKLNKKKINLKVCVSKNQNLGNFSTSSLTAKVRYRRCT